MTNGSSRSAMFDGAARGPIHQVPIPIWTLACQTAAYAKNAATHAAPTRIRQRVVRSPARIGAVAGDDGDDDGGGGGGDADPNGGDDAAVGADAGLADGAGDAGVVTSGWSKDIDEDATGADAPRRPRSTLLQR